MPSLRARAAFGFVAALAAAGCVEVEVRRTLKGDLSGRETISLRAPKSARTEAFPGLFSGGTAVGGASLPRVEGDSVVLAAEATFPDVARFRHQAEFLASAAAIEANPDGSVAYRETLTNSYIKSLGRAPSDEARKSLTAAMEEAKKSLAGARLTYTIQFPGPVARSNADRVSGSEATWVLTPDKLFAARAAELTAEYRTGPAPALAAAVPPAGTVPVAAPAPAKPPEPAPKPPEAPAPPRPAPPVAAPAPKPTEAPVTRPSSRLEDILLAQADEPKEKEAPAPKVAPKKEPPEETTKEESQPKPTPPKTGTGKIIPPKGKPVEEPVPVPLPKKPPTDLAEAPGDDPTTAEVKKLFRDALVHIDFRRYDQAAEALQKALALKPDSILISNLYEKVVAIVIDTVAGSTNPELKALKAQAEALQQLALKGRIRQLRDPNRIKELIDALRSKQFLPRTFAIEELTLAGDYAVPHLLKLMIDTPDAELRAYAGHILSRMRGVAIPAICEATKHNDPMIRQILILALEVIADPRSAPALLGLAQEPNGHPLVVAAAKRALAKLSDDPAFAQTPAPAAFLGLAKDYYDANRKILTPHVYEHLVWRYEPDKKALVSETVPQQLYPPRMAEETCRNALLADPGYEPAVPLLICACFAQQNIIETFYGAIAGKAELSKDEQAEADLAKPLRERAQMAPAIAHAAGQKFIYAALQLALRDARPDVALSCIQALRDVATADSLPAPPPSPEEILKAAEKKKREATKRRRVMVWYGPEEKEEPPPPPAVVKPNAIALDGTPLTTALSYRDRRVRYAAAEAIVAIAPTHVIRDAPLVMANLAQALSETASHVALLFEEDPARAEEIRPLLNEAGVQPVLVRAQTDALAAARELPPKDVLIISGELKLVDPAEAVASLRKVYTVAAAPLIVIMPKADDGKLRDRLAKENALFLSRPLTAGSVRAAIEQVLKGAPDPRNKEASVRCAASAARTLASINPGTSIFRLDDALDALLVALSTTAHPDGVRIPCCEAVRRAANPKAIPFLTQTYADPRASKHLRLAILRALGACAGGPAPVPPSVAATLTLAASDPDPDFRRAAALGFGLKGGATDDIAGLVDRLQGRIVAPAPPPAKPPEKEKEKEAAPPPKEDKPPATLPAEKAPAEKEKE
ncbi:MAG: hypothetical protein FJ291_03550 [Planctomycetes bacterium]|nr:hypothetical protein [Planctomycetota bacterium]